MTDPLLTIDEATRAFRTSPKTIRRRLAAGEIEGAYKRPGDRGPEWVMPAGSLVAAGFSPRPGADAPALPEDPAELAAYWERRALDAEAASRVRPEREVDREPMGWRLPALAIAALVLVVLAFVAGQYAAGGDDDAVQPDAEVVRTLLLARTRADEVIGVVGAVPPEVVPDGRRARQLDVGGLPEDVPRYVVSTLRDGWTPAAVRELRTSAAVLLTFPGEGTDGMQVFDTRSPALDGADDGWRDSPATTSVADASTSTSVGPAPTPAPAASEQAPQGAGPSDPGAVGAPTPPSADEGTEHTVEAGDSFWSVAADVVSAGGEKDAAAITRYWAALLDANAERLVEPGNPDLLHVGQVLLLPPAG